MERKKKLTDTTADWCWQKSELKIKNVPNSGDKLLFRAGILRGVLVAVGAGLMWFIIYSSYALAFWYGVKLIMDDRVECFTDLEECNVR